jgi:hypothetical protein
LLEDELELDDELLELEGKPLLELDEELLDPPLSSIITSPELDDELELLDEELLLDEEVLDEELLDDELLAARPLEDDEELLLELDDDGFAGGGALGLPFEQPCNARAPTKTSSATFFKVSLRYYRYGRNNVVPARL